jgi:hypothetical protein
MAHLARVRLFVIFVAPVSFRPVLQKFLFVRGLSWVVTPTGGQAAMTLVPLVVGLLSVFVAYGRWRLTPHRDGGSRQ